MINLMKHIKWHYWKDHYELKGVVIF